MPNTVRLTEAQRRLLLEICRNGVKDTQSGRSNRRTLQALKAKGLLEDWGSDGQVQPKAAAFAALGIPQPRAASRTAVGRNGAHGRPTGEPRPPTKRQRLYTLLERPEGASLADLQAAVGWQAHSVRGFLSGTVRKTSALTTLVDEAGVRRYRVEADGRG
ncbi:MAG: DUF3489 domain-containing protein [Pseudomonadota bacterium]